MDLEIRRGGDGASSPPIPLSEKQILDFVEDTKELKVILRRPTDRIKKDIDIKKCFFLPTTGSKGLALILNVKEFDYNNKRVGSEIDVRYMTELFTQLGFEVYPPDVVTKDNERKTKVEFLQILEQFAKLCNEKRPSSIFVFIGSHGLHPLKIITSDELELDLFEDIVYKLSREYCPGLQETPKIFLVQACQSSPGHESVYLDSSRGAEDSAGQAPSEISSDLKIKTNVKDPCIKNIFVVTCVTPLQSAMRDRIKGSWFPYCFTYKMMRHALMMESLQEIIKKVQKMLPKIRSKDGVKQVPTRWTLGTTIEEFYFSGPENVISSKIEIRRKLCVSYIIAGDYGKAVEEYQGLAGDDPDPSQIIHDAYDNDNENLEKVLKFINLFPNGDDDAEKCGSLFNTLKSNGHLGKPNSLLFLDTLIKRNHLDLRKRLEPHTGTIINGWPDMIRTGNFRHFASFIQSTPFWLIQALEINLPEVIRRSYKSREDFQNLLSFVNGLPSYLLAVGYSSLLQKVGAANQNQDICDYFDLALQIAYQVKSRSGEHPDLAQLEESFPEPVRSIIWRRVCWMRNAKWDEYLYAAGEDFKMGEGEDDVRRVFTWRGRDDISGFVNFKWVLEPMEEGQMFYIKNAGWPDGKYLSQTDRYNVGTSDMAYALDEDRQFVHCLGVNDPSGGMAGGKWKLELVKNHQGQQVFTIKGKNDKSGRDAYLYASNDTFPSHHSDVRRRMFTWVPGEIVKAAYWELIFDEELPEVEFAITFNL